MKKGLQREWIIAVGIFFFSLFTIFYLIPTQIEDTEEYDLKSLSPVFFPEVSAALIAVLSILLMIILFRSSRHQGEEIAPITWGDELRVLAAMGIAAVYVLAFKYIGFIPASILGLGGLFWLQGKRRPLRLSLLSVGTVLFVYCIFYYIMKVRFPEGLWWP
jgi:magnesium-transporting ATPase (P-type)